jgi:hypothetical protein
MSREEIEERQRMFHEESKHVFRLKIGVMLVLFAAAIGVSVTVYFITRNAEVQKFEATYEGASEIILSK